MRLEHEFEVTASPDETLALMVDPERVVPCMPGATLVEVVDADTWKAELEVKLGPVLMLFALDISRLELDDAAHGVRLKVGGREKRGKGGAQATIGSSVEGRDGGGSTVRMETDLRFFGQVAQLGRPGIVEDVSNQLVGQFADCLGAKLSAQREEAGARVEEA